MMDEDNFYSEEDIEEQLENDEIDSSEEGFMIGYLNGSEREDGIGKKTQKKEIELTF